MSRGPEYKTKYADILHQARYNIASARYQQAQRQKGTDRTETLQRAKTAIISTYALYPDLGGAKWRQKYDRLLKQIQKGLGQPTDGLPSPSTAVGQTGSSPT
jgi:hypothetical protein